MELYAFHLMPYPKIDPDVREKYSSAWVVYPNSEYDPELGQRLYGEYLDQLTFADQIGFDAVVVNEHHQNAYGLMPSPNIMASALIDRTTNAKIAILGNGIALRDNPLRVAEEVAMLDVMSGGRVLSGFVRGIGAEYHSMGLDPTRSRSRFFEAHDLIVKAWTEPGPFSWDGENYQFRYVNVAASSAATPSAHLCSLTRIGGNVAVGCRASLSARLHVCADGTTETVL